MTPVSKAEKQAWRFFLSLHRDHWRAARAMFRRACQGEEPAANLIQFVADTGMTDSTLLAELKTVLRDLAAENNRPR